MNRSTILILLAAGAVYYLLNAAAGAMLPPEPGQERTRYGYWYRFVQRLAANSEQLAGAKLLPAIARSLAAEDTGEPYAVVTGHHIHADTCTETAAKAEKEIHIMANKVETFFEKIGAWLKAHFTKVPAIEVQVSSAANYLVPFVEELDTLLTPELSPIVNPLLDKIKTGLAALATTITDATAAGKANVASILSSLQTNAASLESAFHVEDQATQAKVTGTIQLLNGEFTAIQAQLALSPVTA